MKGIRFSSWMYQLASNFATGYGFRANERFQDDKRKTWRNSSNTKLLDLATTPETGETFISTYRPDGRGASWVIQTKEDGRLPEVSISGHVTHNDLAMVLAGAVEVAKTAEKLTGELNAAQVRFDEEVRRASIYEAQADGLKLETQRKDSEVAALNDRIQGLQDVIGERNDRIGELESALAWWQTHAQVLEEALGDDGSEPNGV